MIGILMTQGFFLTLDVDLAIGDVNFVLGQYSGDFETRCCLIDESGKTVQLPE